ncbi:MAG: hypothetical protein GF401_14730 [Chitinivibrionales bacterium]|nr:hypothetical protein [Chitinivibrionales bacterium]
MRRIETTEGSVLITVIIVAVIGVIAALVTLRITNRIIETSKNKRVNVSLLNVAEASKEHLLANLRTKNFMPQANTRLIAAENQQNGQGNYTVSCSANTAMDSVWIRSVAVNDGKTRSIDVIASISPEFDFTITGVRGAVTACGFVRTIGTVTIDGRNHDADGNVIDDGLYGISTCNTVSQEGASKIGGNGTAPFTSATSSEINQNADCTGYPTTPEEVLGILPGDLDEYKVASLPSGDFHGIYYLTNDYGPIDFGVSSGIIICHNDTRSADFQVNNGVFGGIIIADRIDHFNGDAELIGAVITLAETGEEIFGNGTAIIKYCSSLVENIEEYCDNMNWEIKELSWRERAGDN